MSIRQDRCVKSLKFFFTLREADLDGRPTYFAAAVRL